MEYTVVSVSVIEVINYGSKYLFIFFFSSTEEDVEGTEGSTCQQPIVTNGQSCHDDSQTATHSPPSMSSPESSPKICPKSSNTEELNSKENDPQEDIPKENVPTENIPQENILVDVNNTKNADVTGSSPKENSPLETAKSALTNDVDKKGKWIGVKKFTTFSSYPKIESLMWCSFSNTCYVPLMSLICLFCISCIINNVSNFCYICLCLVLCHDLIFHRVVLDLKETTPYFAS